jgi:hypothetical protein
MEVTIRVVCENLPDAAREQPTGGMVIAGRRWYLGLQRGEAVVDAMPVDGSSIVLEAVFRVAEREDGTTNFLGPYAKGSVSERFLYLSWLEAGDGGETTRYGRAKVHLSHLPWTVVARAAQAGVPLTVMLSLTDTRGGPRCGSIRGSEARWEL